MSLISIYFFGRILSVGASEWIHNYIPLYMVLISGIMLYYLINRYNRLLLKDEHYFELFDLLRQFNHSNDGLKYIDHLLFLFNNIELNKNNGKKLVLNEFRFFLENTMPLLINLNRFYASLYQKNLLRKHILTIQKMVKKNVNNSFTRPASFIHLQKELKELKEKLALMRRNVEFLFRTDIVSKLSSAINRFPQFTRVSFRNESGQSELFALIPDKDFTQITWNVLQNALEAMDGQKEKPIDISIVQEDESTIQISIRDYGKGLPAGTEKLFVLGYSTKNSTGMGLYHSKKLLEPFGGRINLHSANQGKGTKALLTMRLYNGNNNFND